MNSTTPRILIIGYTGDGKSTAAAALAERYECEYANSSDILVESFFKVHANKGDDPKTAIMEIGRNKGVYREQLFRFGNLCKKEISLSWLSDEALKRAPIVTGLRTQDELAASAWAYDLILWVGTPDGKPGTTDKLTPANANASVIVERGDIAGLCEQVIEVAERELAKPVAYIIGRYRHYMPGTKPEAENYDWATMQCERIDEAKYAALFESWGYRVFAPISTHRPLDNVMTGDEILGFCLKRVNRFRPSDCIVIRDGWKDVDGLPDSVGAEAEINAADAIGTRSVGTHLGIDAMKLWTAENYPELGLVVDAVMADGGEV